ncbi:MAG: hypothetical protein Q9174_003406 [Haloplaca sp. 1 TL-2023]
MRNCKTWRPDVMSSYPLQGLLIEFDEVKRNLKNLESEREREKTTAEMFFERLQASQDEVKALRRASERNAFVLVLIDGDCMNFLDDLMKKLEAGGEETAERLRTAIRKYIQEHLSDIRADAEPLVRIFANIRGLAKTLVDAKILDSPEDLGRFVCGFNKKFTSFDFIDAGNGKECSDAKLKKSFELFIRNAHCKHIIFGGSADNGYARLLDSYTGDPSSSKMITMLEGPPFAHELAPIAEKFKQCEYRSRQHPRDQQRHQDQRARQLPATPLLQLQPKLNLRVNP